MKCLYFQEEAEEEVVLAMARRVTATAVPQSELPKQEGLLSSAPISSFPATNLSPHSTLQRTSGGEVGPNVWEERRRKSSQGEGSGRRAWNQVVVLPSPNVQINAEGAGGVGYSPIPSPGASILELQWCGGVDEETIRAAGMLPPKLLASAAERAENISGGTLVQELRALCVMAIRPPHRGGGGGGGGGRQAIKRNLFSNGTEAENMDITALGAAGSVRGVEALDGLEAARYAFRCMAALGVNIVCSLGTRVTGGLLRIPACKIWEPEFYESLRKRRDSVLEKTPALQFHQNGLRLAERQSRGIGLAPTNTMQSSRPEEESRHHWKHQPDVFNDRERFVDRLYGIVFYVRGNFEDPEEKMRNVVMRAGSLTSGLMAQNFSWAAEKIVDCVLSAAVWGEEDPTLQKGDPERLQQLSKRMDGVASQPDGNVVSQESNQKLRGGSRPSHRENRQKNVVGKGGNFVGPQNKPRGGTEGRRIQPEKYVVSQMIRALDQPLQTYVLILVIANNHRLSTLVRARAVQKMMELRDEIAGALHQKRAVESSRTGGPTMNLRETVLKLQSLSTLVTALALYPYEQDFGGLDEDPKNIRDVTTRELRLAARDAVEGLLGPGSLFHDGMYSVLVAALRARSLSATVPWVLSMLRCISHSSGVDALSRDDEVREGASRDEASRILDCLSSIRRHESVQPRDSRFSTGTLCVCASIDAFLEEVGYYYTDKNININLFSDIQVAASGLDDDGGQLDVAYIRSFCMPVHGIWGLMEQELSHEAQSLTKGGTRKIRAASAQSSASRAVIENENRDKMELLVELLNENPGFKNVVEFAIGAVVDVVASDPVLEKIQIKTRCSDAIAITLNVLAPPNLAPAIVEAAASMATELAVSQCLKKIESRRNTSSTTVAPHQPVEGTCAGKLREKSAGGGDVEQVDTHFVWASPMLDTIANKTDRIISIMMTEEEGNVLGLIDDIASAIYGLCRTEAEMGTSNDPLYHDSTIGRSDSNGSTADSGTIHSAFRKSVAEMGKAMRSLAFGIGHDGLPLDGACKFSANKALITPLSMECWLDGELIRAVKSCLSNDGDTQLEALSLAEDTSGLSRQQHIESLESRSLASPLTRHVCCNFRKIWPYIKPYKRYGNDLVKEDDASSLKLIVESILDIDAWKKAMKCANSPVWARRASYTLPMLTLLLIPEESQEDELVVIIEAWQRWLKELLDVNLSPAANALALRAVAAVVEHLCIALLIAKKGFESTKIVEPLAANAVLACERQSEVRVRFWLMRVAKAVRWEGSCWMYNAHHSVL